MIKVAILEYEKETKDIVFQLSKLFMHEDWCFRHYLKASDLAKRMKEEEYQLFVFDEMFKTSRIESVFVHDNPNAIVIYVCENPIKTRGDDERSRHEHTYSPSFMRTNRDTVMFSPTLAIVALTNFSMVIPESRM